MSREIIDLHRYIDHTLLKPNASVQDLDAHCREAIEYDFGAVCIPPFYIAQAEKLLRSTNSAVCSVIGFPLGYSSTESKLYEVKKAIDQGAQELDVVINQSWVNSEMNELLVQEMYVLTQYVQSQYGLIKWIVETSNLSIAEQKLLCTNCLDVGADFIKTSTGFAEKGAQIKDVERWNKMIGEKKLKIKASGGIKNSKDACSFISSGAERIGCSAGVQIIKEYTNG